MLPDVGSSKFQGYSSCMGHHIGPIYQIYFREPNAFGSKKMGSGIFNPYIIHYVKVDQINICLFKISISLILSCSYKIGQIVLQGCSIKKKIDAEVNHCHQN